MTIKIKLIDIQYDTTGTFVKRDNRFVVSAKIGETIEKVHLHDPGRLKELLITDNKLYLKKANNPNRKTQWTLIAVDKEKEVILINASFHRKIFEAILNNHQINQFGPLKNIKAEVKYGASRLDFQIFTQKGGEIWIEGKGCSLSEDGVAKFPDAPSIRAVKHLNELMKLKKSGKRAAIYIAILSNATVFTPNRATDPLFADTFKLAVNAGVEVYPLQLSYHEQQIWYHGILDFMI